ncbi:MAG TPA: hypothetical protein VK929_14145 [Longimicrobiales bacterium]|nr:hypothetical protein [Longimicrobiales bacterium]
MTGVEPMTVGRRSRLPRTAWLVLAGVVASGASSAPALSQVLVTADQQLDFGLLTPGVPMTVVPTDVARRAAYTVATRGRYAITFQLPSHLVEVHGAAVPVAFGDSDGRVEIRHRVTTFDPAAGVSIHINPADSDARIYLGGTAQPAPGTPAGSYSATIIMMIVPTGT